ncbi:hypothetical protein ACFQGT_04060 [Natrialbaceae archaeon GCM10025810]|uniref:hypothetical protein n=1 Tax=Halovalidus salilacus TaxID=3075124 RepID=UPI0036089F0D
MASRQQMMESEPTGGATEDVDQQALGPALLAAGASVGLSWYYFFLKGDRQRGIFVGLWPPTILAFASYLNQRKIRNQLDTLMRPGSTLKDAIDSMMGNR